MTFPEKKRNLIYIYLESMEMTFADGEKGGAFPQNVIPELTELSMEGDNFSGNTGLLNGGHVMPGSTYTMAGIFTQSSGLPLKMDLGEEFTDARGSFNKMNTQDSFFSGVTTIGDILEGEGYNQAFMLGSDATFGGRRLFWTEHGDYEIDDYKWAIEQGLIPKDYYVFWGYEDEKLFSYAKNKVLELADQEEPFNFSMLTVDTHFEDGYRCGLCRDDFEGNQYANAFACSSRQVSEFIRWIQEQDFYENTTVVIVGDHPTMDASYCRNIDPSYVRRVYTCIMNAPVKPVRDAYRSYSTLDMFPTTLTALGVEIPGGRLGLGTSLYTNQRTLTEELGYTAVSSSLSRYSLFLLKRSFLL
jgi:phosphoglycerol transferase